MSERKYFMDERTISVAGMRKLGSSAGLFVLSNSVVFPYSLTPVSVDSQENISIVREAMKSDRMIAMFPEYNYTGKGVPTQLPPI